MSESFEEMHQALLGAAGNGSLGWLQEIISKMDNDDERKELINSLAREGTVLHFAVSGGHVDIIEWVLSEQGGRAAGFDSVLAFCDYDGYTALHVAAEEGQLDACKAIVNGCRVENGEREELLNATDQQNGGTVLHCAVRRDHLHIIKWLLSSEEGGGRALGFHSILKGTFYKNSIALHLAMSFETFLAVVDGCHVDNGERQEMLNAVDAEGWNFLHFAVQRNQPAMISWLLSEEEGGAAGFDRSLVTALAATSESSVLHLAAGRSIENLQALLSHCSEEEKTKLFLAVENNGWTALHYAARNDCQECIVELLRHPKANLIANRKDNTGMTVLHRAIIGGIDEESLLEWEYGFRPNPAIIGALLGSSAIGWTLIDANIGLGLE